MKTGNSQIQDDLLYVIEQVYKRNGYTCSSPTPEEESAEYGACTFTIGHRLIRYRAGKITPTKTGQFVTLWKRSPDGIIQPFSLTDPVDYVVITTRDEANLGQFIFSKSQLQQHGILSDDQQTGKLGFRIYPPWDHPTNKQALKTQQWQCAAFIEFTGSGIDVSRLELLLDKP